MTLHRTLDNTSGRETPTLSSSDARIDVSEPQTSKSTEDANENRRPRRSSQIVSRIFIFYHFLTRQFRRSFSTAPSTPFSTAKNAFSSLVQFMSIRLLPSSSYVYIIPIFITSNLRLHLNYRVPSHQLSTSPAESACRVDNQIHQLVSSSRTTNLASSLCSSCTMRADVFGVLHNSFHSAYRRILSLCFNWLVPDLLRAA